MSGIYKLGVVIGIIVIYSLATLFAGALSNYIIGSDDKWPMFCMAWVVGVLAFIGLATFTLEKFGLWM